MSLLSNSFKKLDVFGSKITLNYQGDILYRTPFGGVMAVLLVSFLTILFFSSVNYIDLFIFYYWNSVEKTLFLIYS